jgi:transposase
MSTQRFTPEFKEEAVKLVLERGYSVAEVAARPWKLVVPKKQWERTDPVKIEVQDNALQRSS